MTLQESVINVLEQLKHSIEKLSEEQFATKINILSGASVGEHVRHVIELFICLEEGYGRGLVNYEKRKRDIRIQTSIGFATEKINNIIKGLMSTNKYLKLEAGYNENSDELLSFETNYFREIAYNIEHTIHHMALIKIGIEKISSVRVPENFGVASSTVKYRKITETHIQ